MVFVKLLLLVFGVWLMSLVAIVSCGLSPEASSSSVATIGSKSVANKIDSVLKNFQINRNSIIKTHDSQMLGAKYLNETELSSNEECILWCWNTSACNLAVFEEKTRGSCYLFDCGTIEDFKCRFAVHTFYTSSILQANRNSFLLNEWKSQASQENDLVGLKGKIADVASAAAVAAAAKLDQGKGVDGQLEPGMAETTTAHTKVSKCRHYQFECRNNSECIAIYNVCDGITQCSDGSDEAEELECHKSRLSVNTNGNGKNYVETIVESGGSRNANTAADQDKTSSSSSSSKNQAQTSGSSGTNSYMVPAAFAPAAFESRYSAGYNYPKTANEKTTNMEDSHNRLQPMMANGGDYNGYLMANWNQYQAMAAAAASAEKSSPGILLNEATAVETNQYQKEPPLLPQSNPYWPSFKYQSVDGLVQQPQLPQQLRQSLANQQDPLSIANYNVPISLINDATATVTRNKILDLNSSSYQRQPEAKLRPPSPIVSAAQELVRVRLMNITNSKNSTTNTNTGNGGSVVGSKAINYARISSSARVAASPAAIVAMAVMHDSPAGTANGRETNSAVIALTFGLFITGILIVIVGCRMKSFKKRLARRGRSLAHDADYLINGMYL